MNSDQINLVQQSFEEVQPIAPVVAQLFYYRLFLLDPSLKPMFKGDMGNQGRMLMSMMGSAVKGLSDLDGLAPVLRSLGARHEGYGVREEHYVTVGTALLWSLNAGLGEKFTPEVREAWTVAYGLVADVMQFGALEAQRIQRHQSEEVAVAW
ncbi:globin family protein [Rhodoferax sp.]|uniref:globin family protein n=1 Tax=Rhodoferax sp. TaxID=50421 RepID=UPI002ACE673B|nr:globin family protein [Rhodoferax sp.]MDZ7919831.1 globin family protein [Rhodoferax sp.]